MLKRVECLNQLLNINHQRLNLPKRKNQEWVRDMPSTSLDWEELINLDSRLIRIDMDWEDGFTRWGRCYAGTLGQRRGEGGFRR